MNESYNFNKKLMGYRRAVFYNTKREKRQLNRADYEELCNDCLFAASRGMKRYNPNGKSTMDTFVWKCINSERDRFMRKIKNKNAGTKTECEINENIADSSPHELLSDNKIITEDMKEKIFSMISGREREIIKMRLEGLKYPEIGDKYGYSRQWAQQSIKRIIKKIQKAINTVDNI